MKPSFKEGVLYEIIPLTESLTGIVYTSPSGMFIIPASLIEGMPLIENVKSVPSPKILTLSV
ncbi:hypothetical protein D3C76_1423030 [compost metagenome]